MSASAVDRVGVALRAHVDARRRAEQQRAAFAFTERAPARAGEAGEGDDAGGLDSVDWRWFAGRTLHTAGEPGTLRLLAGLRDGPVRMAAAGDLEPDGHGRLALVERIGDLAAAGLVTRELARDEVALAPLGAAVLELVADIARSAGADPS